METVTNSGILNLGNHLQVKLPANIEDILKLPISQDDNTKPQTLSLDINKFSLAMGRLIIVANDMTTSVLAVCMPEFSFSAWDPEFINNIVPASLVTMIKSKPGNLLYIATINQKVKIKRLKHFKIKLDQTLMCEYNQQTDTIHVTRYFSTILTNCFIGEGLIEQNPEI